MKKIYQPKDNDPIWITLGDDYSVDPPIYKVVKMGTFIDNTVYRGTQEECIQEASRLYQEFKNHQK
jgi:hypothetical protein